MHGVLPEKHKLIHKDLISGKPFKNAEFPSIFRIVENNLTGIGLRMASFTSWSPINTGIIENSEKVYKYSPMINEGWFMKLYLYIMDHLKMPVYDNILLKRLLKFLRANNNTKLLFVQLTDVDEVGHHHGYETSKYNKQMKKTDNHIKLIIEELNKSNKDTLVLITTDHGGIKKSHGGDDDKETKIFIAADGMGQKLIDREITNMDCAAVILQALNIEIPSNFDAISFLS